MNAATKSDGLQKVKRTRLSDQVAAELKRLIASGTYAPGTRLPTEAELAIELGVTRLTVREALFQVEAAGFTQTRHGSGTYVVDLDEAATFGLLAELLAAGKSLSPEDCLALMELRSVVVGGFAPSLIERVTDEQVAQLRGVVEQGRGALGDAQRLAQLDYRFNELLARASGNTFYLLLIRSVRAVHVRLGEVIFTHHHDDAVIVATHEAIASALDTRSQAKLKKSIATYLEGGTTIVRAWAARSGQGPKRAASMGKAR
jgi:DNA-binding FadR family transcriptional regulator